MKMNAGKVCGAIMLAAGVGAIWLWPKAKAEQPEQVAVRPVRSIVVSGEAKIPRLTFPGKVKAGRTRHLVFEVPGRLIEFDLDNGQNVEKGEVLAKLDTRDYEADLKKAEAAYERAKLTLSRMRDAASKGGVSKEEVSKAETDEKTAQAQLDKAKKALESCVLRAPFDGVVADTYPSSLDMVSVGQKILTLQSTDKIKFDVSIPETLVVAKSLVELSKERRHYVIFDSLPGKQFDVKFEDFTTKADDVTQTFNATFSMAEQEGYTFLPGMSVTLVIEGDSIKATKEFPLVVPTAAVWAGDDGRHFVWKLEKAEKEGEYRTVRQAVETGELSGTSLEIRSGLEGGERIAVAGVALLSEGRIVTLWKER